MNFSGVSSRSIVGQLLRFPLRLIPANAVLPILQGELRGSKWIAGSSNHGCWLGSYEYEKQRLISGMIAPGSTVFDLGAHVGFYTLLLSRLVGSAGKVVAFEPFPPNLRNLRRHLALNHITNVEVIEAAVSETVGTASFQSGKSSSMGQIDEAGEFRVELVSIDELRRQGKLPLPGTLKIDIEGAEYRALLGAEQTLREAHPTIFLATHGTAVHDQCCDFLLGLGYQLRAVGEADIANTDELIATYAGV